MSDIIDIGMTIVSKGARAIRRSNGIPAPVSGLEYLNFFCKNPDYPDPARNLSRNLVRGKPRGRIIGVPVLNDKSATFHSLVDYIDSGVSHTDSMTLIAIAKAPDPAEESAILSNFNGTKPGGGTSQGTGIMFRPNSFYYNNALVNSDGSLSLAQISTPYTAGEWAIIEARSAPATGLNGGNFWFTQHGVTTSKAYGLPNGARVDIGGNIMIGSLGGNLGSVNGKPAEISAAAIFSRALSADEVLFFRNWLKSIYQYQYGWAL
ncbi:hypothetical protein ACLHG3_000830 [Serratia marcescens]|uniref:hypothetical protein n=1 Tax=Serratia marcescens TaxID=615 RepID=UPI0039E58EE0